MKINAKNKFFSKEREDINQLGKLKPNEFWSRDSEDISLSDFLDYFCTFSNSSSDHNLHNYACTNNHI